MLTKDGILGKTPAAAAQRIQRGGLTVRTTLDKDAQKAADQAIRDRVAAKNPSKVAAAMAVVEPGTGKILAMSQSQPYGRNTKKGQTDLNYAADYNHGGSGGFQPGSTFKAFTLAAALKSGMPLQSRIYAPRHGTPFPASDFNSTACWPAGNLGARYAPGNSEGDESGLQSLDQITYRSVNTGFVALEAKVGICKVKAVVDALGVRLARPSTEVNDGKALGRDQAVPDDDARCGQRLPVDHGRGLRRLRRRRRVLLTRRHRLDPHAGRQEHQDPEGRLRRGHGAECGPWRDVGARGRAVAGHRARGRQGRSARRGEDRYRERLDQQASSSGTPRAWRRPSGSADRPPRRSACAASTQARAPTARSSVPPWLRPSGPRSCDRRPRGSRSRTSRAPTPRPSTATACRCPRRTA
ncbi:hypothetical protein GCM10025868_17800 [Angustibacter aerolatus]|uniref:Penicillin-binding protein transpeptidase domain-containing protein n=1 Tax=Angustibacter aerolatus TaxID=1162965 RepID=A0ABQ6JI80_9ACTN|nr:penicillin-binding transpeptidase domain-containing protein [Angustibacter aerolatus]GMA86530.1 hypothetical protein GCM10025868_17800 [Angustibacter aerolatus]